MHPIRSLPSHLPSPQRGRSSSVCLFLIVERQPPRTCSGSRQTKTLALGAKCSIVGLTLQVGPMLACGRGGIFKIASCSPLLPPTIVAPSTTDKRQDMTTMDMIQYKVHFTAQTSGPDSGTASKHGIPEWLLQGVLWAPQVWGRLALVNAAASTDTQ